MTTPDSPPAGSPPVEVRRSKRRRRTVQAYMRDETVVVLLPARMTKAEERFWVKEMVGRLERQEERRQRRRNRSDAELLARARELAGTYLDGRAQPTEVRWVDNQNDRWGSCTPSQGTIRLSDRLRDFPRWVSDYVLVHELAHLLEPAHDEAFWRLVDRYPRTERARGFLEGVLTAHPTPPPAAPPPTVPTEVTVSGAAPAPSAAAEHGHDDAAPNELVGPASEARSTDPGQPTLVHDGAAPAPAGPPPATTRANQPPPAEPPTPPPTAGDRAGRASPAGPPAVERSGGGGALGDEESDQDLLW